MEATILRCPICGQPLNQQEKTLVCGNRHSFDIARQGYVNLLPVTQKHSKHPGDTRDMVAARRAFLDRGYYAPIAQTVQRIFGERMPEHPKVLDAGCGEGYYLSQLMPHLPGGTFLGVDISKDAVRYAAGRCKSAMWITASAAHLPVMDGRLDGVMSMFALTMPEEFHRVLTPGGYYLEVTAGREHLMALKELIYPEITEKQEKKSKEYPGFRLVQEETLEFDFSLTEHQEIMQLLTMTPHLWRISREGAQRAAEAETLDDRAQVLFRLYQIVATSSGL